MIKALEKLNREELELLLEFQLNLDKLLDKGMVNRQDIEIQIKEALQLLGDTLRIHNGYSSVPLFSIMGVVFLDHFDDPNIVILNHLSKKEAFRKLQTMLREENLVSNIPDEMDKHNWRQMILDLKDRETYYGDSLTFNRLEVSGQFLGFVFAGLSNPGHFHKTVFSHFAGKLDTDIFAYNKMIFEKIKSDGQERINSILDSDMHLDEKYHEVLKMIVQTVRANSGFLIIPKDGSLEIMARHIKEGTESPLEDEKLLDIAKKTVEKAEQNVFKRFEEVDIPDGELLSMVLKPGDKNIEGIMILHHSDFLDPHHEVAVTLSNLVDSSLFVDRLYGLIFKNFINTLGEIIDTFDTYTSGHSDRVSRYSVALGKVLGLTQMEMTKLKVSSILHDIGKVGIDPHIIRKKGRLTPEERMQIENHARYSGSILKGVFPFELSDIYNLAMSHHEKEDGSGYPNKLPGKEIPLISKIISVADVFDALTSDRPYHKGRTREKAIDILEEDVKRGKFSKSIVDTFKGEQVWCEIRETFFQLKVVSAFEWYKKEMLPDISKMESSLQLSEKCITDLGELKKKYDSGEEITMELLEDSLLYPSDKDRLIQRDIQKNREKYNVLIFEIMKKYKENLESVRKKINEEKRFREEFWQPDTINEVQVLFERIVKEGIDLLKPLEEISPELFSKAEADSHQPILRILEIKLDESEELKGPGDDYLKPVSKLKEFAENLIGTRIKEQKED